MLVSFVFFFFFKQKTAYEMRISDWSSDVCSSDLKVEALPRAIPMSAVTTPLLLRRTAAVPGTGLAVSFATVVARSFLDLEIFFSDCDICDPVSRDRKSTRLNSSH